VDVFPGGDDQVLIVFGVFYLVVLVVFFGGFVLEALV